MKQFDEEYKEHVRENAPSLWDRIEAGVDEKISITSVSERGTVKRKTVKRDTKKKWQRHIRFATSLAACFAALLLAVPVFRMVGNKHTEEMAQYAAAPQETESIMEDTEEEVLPSQENAKAAGDVATQSETAAEVCDEEAENAVTEIAYEGEAAETEYVANAGNQAALAAEADAWEEKQEATALGDNDNETMTESQEARGFEEEAESSETFLSEEQCENAYIKVLEKLQTADGFVYTVEILEDNGKSLQAAQIWKLSAAGSQTEMETGGTYRIQVSVAEPETMQATLFNMQNN